MSAPGAGREREAAPSPAQPERGTPTISDIARLAGVSPATVSRVLNGGKKVGPDTRRRVEQVMRDLDYRVNPHARGLRSSRPRAVAFLMTETSDMLYENPVLVTLIHETSTALDARGFAQMILVAGSPAEQQRAMQVILGGYVDGVMLVSTHPSVRPLLNLLLKRRVPVVACGLPPGLAGRVCSVESDDYYGGGLAAVHLEDLGCRRLATITGPDEVPGKSGRVSGFLESTEGVRPLVVRGDYSVASGRRCMADLLGQDPRIDGVFAGNDAMAFGAMEVLAHRGRRVPQDVKVIGFDDSPFARQTDPPLTTLRQDFPRMAVAMVAALEGQLRGEPPHDRVVFKTELVIRGTTAPAPDQTPSGS